MVNFAVCCGTKQLRWTVIYHFLILNYIFLFFNREQHCNRCFMLVGWCRDFKLTHFSDSWWFSEPLYLIVLVGFFTFLSLWACVGRLYYRVPPDVLRCHVTVRVFECFLNHVSAVRLGISQARMHILIGRQSHTLANSYHSMANLNINRLHASGFVLMLRSIYLTTHDWKCRPRLACWGFKFFLKNIKTFFTMTILEFFKFIHNLFVKIFYLILKFQLSHWYSCVSCFFFFNFAFSRIASDTQSWSFQKKPLNVCDTIVILDS